MCLLKNSYIVWYNIQWSKLGHWHIWLWWWERHQQNGGIEICSTSTPPETSIWIIIHVQKYLQNFQGSPVRNYSTWEKHRKSKRYIEEVRKQTHTTLLPLLQAPAHNAKKNFPAVGEGSSEHLTSPQTPEPAHPSTSWPLKKSCRLGGSGWYIQRAKRKKKNCQTGMLCTASWLVRMKER